MATLNGLALQIAELMGKRRKHSRADKDACATAIERMVGNMYAAKDLSVVYRKQKEQGLLPATYAASQTLASAASGFRRERRAKVPTDAELHPAKLSERRA